jgi:hypothetical protein
MFSLVIDESLESDLQVDYVALVDAPAIEKNFLAFKANKHALEFSAIDPAEHIVIGPAMLADVPIYRRDDQMGEYFVTFSKDTVKTIARKFYAKGFQNNVNIGHDPNQTQEGVTFFLSWIKDSAKGMVGLQGDYPEGTWFLGAQVDNPSVWNDVTTGKVKGFSVEGLFKYKKQQMSDEQVFEKIANLLKDL